MYGDTRMKKKKSNLKIEQFRSPNQKNEYLLIDGNEAATIDVSDAYDAVSHLLTEMDIELKYLLITHAHKAHVRILPRLKESFGGSFCLHKDERGDLRESGSDLEPDRYLKDNETLMLGDTKIKVLLTPGHTSGSVCYYVKQAKALFSGSTFLKSGFGKIWGPHSMSSMHFSLKRLSSTIPDDTVIYTGSGELTKIKNEAWIHCMRSA
jgi:glyoxylase-like metal-dependent hydrolase (beta-lactamase superfamily II)